MRAGTGGAVPRSRYTRSCDGAGPRDSWRARWIQQLWGEPATNVGEDEEGMSMDIEQRLAPFRG
ncbi:hypothetical protein C8Q74DRAFT_1304611 [Fomes fomentarius]|nr:hypothetical protein C8Q74DRAFT_1304611 [Fomes fomentarius]